jgi:metal-dependent amidase/aminoacylase/carboxypeptidase family protein
MTFQARSSYLAPLVRGRSAGLEVLRCIAEMCLASMALGAAAEESGAGKQILLERGAYKDMDVCIMYVW